jgi:hypothetical protein
MRPHDLRCSKNILFIEIVCVSYLNRGYWTTQLKANMQVLEGFTGVGNTLENFMGENTVRSIDGVAVGSFFLMYPTGSHFYAFEAGANGEITEENNSPVAEEDPLTIDFSSTIFTAHMLRSSSFMQYYVPIEIFPSIHRNDKYYCCVLVRENNTVQHIYDAVAQKHGWPDKIAEEGDVDFSEDAGFQVDMDLILTATTTVSEILARDDDISLGNETNQIILRIFSPFVELGQ